MNAAGRLSLYGAGLVVAFAGAYGISGAVVPQSLVESWNASAATAAEHDMGGTMENGATSSTLEASDSDEVDGFTVSASGHLVTGTPSTVTVTVERDGQPVTLDATASAIVVDASDLSPVALDYTPTVNGAEVTLSVSAPAATRYAIFVDFTVDGQTSTARFALDAMSPADMNMGGS